jgi:hypothetical protein
MNFLCLNSVFCLKIVKFHHFVRVFFLFMSDPSKSFGSDRIRIHHAGCNATSFYNDCFALFRTPAVDPEGSAAVQLRRSHTLRATSSSSSAAGEPTSCRPVSLMDRMSRLNEAQAEWQKKVEDKVTYPYCVIR